MKSRKRRKVVGEKKRMCGFQVVVVVLENLDSKSNPAIESLRRRSLPVDRVVVNRTWGQKGRQRDRLKTRPVPRMSCMVSDTAYTSGINIIRTDGDA